MPNGMHYFLFGFDVDADIELMKEKFAKLLLGEDMSGGGKGVPSAVALSNAITNLAGNPPFSLLPVVLLLVVCLISLVVASHH